MLDGWMGGWMIERLDEQVIRRLNGWMDDKDWPGDLMVRNLNKQQDQ